MIEEINLNLKLINDGLMNVEEAKKIIKNAYKAYTSGCITYNEYIKYIINFYSIKEITR